MLFSCHQSYHASTLAVAGVLIVFVSQHDEFRDIVQCEDSFDVFAELDVLVDVAPVIELAQAMVALGARVSAGRDELVRDSCIVFHKYATPR